MVICQEQGADLHMAQLMPLPLIVSCFSKIQIGFTFLVPAHPGSPGQRAVKRVCVTLNNKVFIIYLKMYNIHLLLMMSRTFVQAKCSKLKWCAITLEKWRCVPFLGREPISG